MIVIATHNGIDFLPNLLGSLNKYGIGNHKLLVVDTQSDDLKFLEYLNEVRNQLGVEVVTTPYAGYDTGAYLYTYRNYSDKDYIFLQDSMTIKNKDWLQKISQRDVTCLFTIPMICDNDSQYQWLNDHFPNTPCNEGIFGPIFYTTKEVLDRANEKHLLEAIPTNKSQQQGYERAWGIIFSTIKAKVNSLYGKYDHIKVINNELPDITKFLPIRP
jgi:hypothetical protein